MKLTLIAKIATLNLDILDFFKNDPRFHIETGGEIGSSEETTYIENTGGMCSDGYLTLTPDGKLAWEDPFVFDNVSLLESQLKSEIPNLIRKINQGNLSLLPELAEMLTEFRQRQEKSGWIPED